MKGNIEIDLLKYKSQIKLRVHSGFRQVFDPIRRKWLIFTPEEMVRQLLIIHFQQALQIPATRISLEKGFSVNGLTRRYDIVVHDDRLKPIMLVECKASGVIVDQSTFDQIFQYNIALNVPFLMVTNGIHNFCMKVDLVDTSIKPIFESSLPPYSELRSVLDEE